MKTFNGKFIRFGGGWMDKKDTDRPINRWPNQSQWIKQLKTSVDAFRRLTNGQPFFSSLFDNIICPFLLPTHAPPSDAGIAVPCVSIIVITHGGSPSVRLLGLGTEGWHPWRPDNRQDLFLRPAGGPSKWTTKYFRKSFISMSIQSLLSVRLSRHEVVERRLVPSLWA